MWATAATSLQTTHTPVPILARWVHSKGHSGDPSKSLAVLRGTRGDNSVPLLSDAGCDDEAGQTPPEEERPVLTQGF